MGIEHLQKRLEDSKADRDNRASGGNWADRIPKLNPEDGDSVIFQLMADLDQCPLVKVHNYLPIAGGKKRSFTCGGEDCPICKVLSGKERGLKDLLCIPVYVPDFEGTTMMSDVREKVGEKWETVKKEVPRPCHYMLLVGPGKDDAYHQFFVEAYRDNKNNLMKRQIRMKVQGAMLTKTITFKELDKEDYPVQPMKTKPPETFPLLTMDELEKAVKEKMHTQPGDYDALVRGVKPGSSTPSNPAASAPQASGAAGWD